MVRAAAKNHASVTVVVDPGDYRALLDELAANQGATNVAMRQKLAAKAFAHTAQYDAMVSAYFTGAIGGGAPTFPDDLNLSFRKHLDLRYGENPHQQAAFYSDPRAIGASVTLARQIQGKELSYNNIADSRYGARMRAPIRHAGLRHRQARQSLRRRARRQHRRRLCARLPHRSHLRLRRHHRVQSRTGRGDAQRAIVEQQFVEVILAPSVSHAAQGAARAQGQCARAAGRRSDACR